MKTLYFLALAALLGAAACGVKGSPRPPIKSQPSAVEGIEVWPREDHILVRWKAPQTGEKAGRTRVTHFVVQRWTLAPGEDVWSGVAIVGEVEAPGGGADVVFKDPDVKPGWKYRYSVVPVGDGGRAGVASPPVEVRWTAPPGAPVGLRAEAGDRSVSLEWQPPEGGGEVEGYYVYRAGPEGWVRLNDTVVPGTSYFDAALDNGVEYGYMVRAVTLAGAYLVEGVPSAEVKAVPTDLDAPQVPVGVDAFPVEGGVMVKWWPNSEPDLAGYNVYRIYGNKQEKLNDAPVEYAEYLDGGAKTGKVYRYSVTAVDKSGNESPQSEQARVYVKR